MSFYQIIYNKRIVINRVCLQQQPTFSWIAFFIWQLHTCVQDILTLLPPSYISLPPSLSVLQSLAIPSPDSWLLVLFCDPFSVTEAICEIIGLELSIGAWRASMKLQLKQWFSLSSHISVLSSFSTNRYSAICLFFIYAWVLTGPFLYRLSADVSHAIY